MNLEDVVYFFCLLFCIGIGKYLIEINDELQRKLICTGVGLFLVFLLSGFHSLHCFLSFGLGAAAMLRAHPSACHLSTFVAMFGYLTFFRLIFIFGLPQAPDTTNMIQMILTLKLVGVAFEKNAAWKKLQLRDAQKKHEDVARLTDVEITDYDVELQTLGYMDLLHYCFNYIGVLIGPYHRFRTYRDYFETPFKQHAPRLVATLNRLKYVAVYCVLFLVANYIWPIEYALSDEFYEQRSFAYRLWYVWPTFFIFRMRIYTGLTLAECVCTMAGFGAYPDAADTTNGEGPRKQYWHLKREAQTHSYNFTTIVNQRVRGVETCWTFREGMKHWNVCVQYWLAINIYKTFPIKKYRTMATLLVSAYWHGFRPGHYLCLMGVPLYVPLEDLWDKLLRQKAAGPQRTCINAVFWTAKFFAYSYLFMAFKLGSLTHIWRYYTSVYHFGYVIWVTLFILGHWLIKRMPQSRTISQ